MNDVVHVPSAFCLGRPTAISSLTGKLSGQVTVASVNLASAKATAGPLKTVDAGFTPPILPARTASKNAAC